MLERSAVAPLRRAPARQMPRAPPRAARQPPDSSPPSPRLARKADSASRGDGGERRLSRYANAGGGGNSPDRRQASCFSLARRSQARSAVRSTVKSRTLARLTERLTCRLSTALRSGKPPRPASPPPAAASPALAPETLPESLASAAARSCGGPHLSRTSGVRAPRWALPLAPSPSEPRPAAPHSRPEVRTPRPPRPNTIARASGGQSGSDLRSVRGCHEGCSRFQPQELLSIVPPRCRIPLAREPSAHGSPPPHRKPACRGRHTGRPSAARSTKDNSVLWPESLSRLARITALTGLFPPGRWAVLAPVASASFTPAPHFADLIS